MPATWSRAISHPRYCSESLSYVLSNASKRRWVIKPNTRLSKDDCDPSHKPDFHRCYRGIVGYLVTVTRPDLAWSYSEFSKYFQLPGIAHMEANEHVVQYLRDTWNESITYTRGSRIPNELWGWVHTDWAGDTDTRRPHTGYILRRRSRCGAIVSEVLCVRSYVHFVCVCVCMCMCVCVRT